MGFNIDDHHAGALDTRGHYIIIFYLQNEPSHSRAPGHDTARRTGRAERLGALGGRARGWAGERSRGSCPARNASERLRARLQKL